MNKRNVCARAAQMLGALLVLERLAQRNCLLVINYHRIGNAESTELDSGVFAATVEEFEAQVTYLRKRYAILTLGEAADLAGKCSDSRGTKILITFDDGYKDNYLIAFRILHSLGVPAAFFIVSSNLDNPLIPWWDRIAFWVRHSTQPTLRLSYPEAQDIPLVPGRRESVILRLLQLYKSPATADPERLLEGIKVACSPNAELPPAADLFVNCEEAREMIRGGMAIGSHTHTHRILAKLSRPEQWGEIAESKAILSRKLGTEVDTLAYPVGGPSSFSETTRSLLAEAGYRAAFSYYGGLNLPAATDRFDMKRVRLDAGTPLSRFRLQTALSVVTKGFWF